MVNDYGGELSIADLKTVAPRMLQDDGYLAAANVTFFQPLGLALAFDTDTDDYRDHDPAGGWFLVDDDLTDKLAKVAERMAVIAPHRLDAVGFIRQADPIEGSPVPIPPE